MTSKELLKEIEAWLSFNTEPSREETAKLRKSIKDHLTEQLRKHDVVGRSSSNDKLVEIAVPENSLILTVNATKHHNRKLFKEWMKEFFDDDVNFA